MLITLVNKIFFFFTRHGVFSGYTDRFQGILRSLNPNMHLVFSNWLLFLRYTEIIFFALALIDKLRATEHATVHCKMALKFHTNINKT